MVQVKFKPQYLVFLMHPLVTGLRTLDFCCGKLWEANRAEALRGLSASKTVQIWFRNWHPIWLAPYHYQA
jgi:hypothetical protein